MKGLIFNAVVTNNGDAALVFGLYEALKGHDLQIQIASNYYKTVRDIYTDYPIVPELPDFKKLRRLPFYWRIRSLSPIFTFCFSAPFRNCDILMASPGGYINSYYGFKRVYYTIRIAKLLGKKVVIYSQSIGPLTEEDAKRMKKMAKYVDLIYARDDFSFNVLENLLSSTHQKNYFRTEDAAFLLPFNPNKKYNSAASKTIAVSVRNWAHDKRNKDKYYALMIAIVESIVSKGFNVVFISTCQGLDNYINDSKVAEEILSQMDDVYIKNNVFIDKGYYKFNELRECLSSFYAVIGTRLHMCVLSMIENVPAFNISYEVKGKELYKYCKMEAYSIDYNENIQIARRKVDLFLNDIDQIRIKLPDIIKERHANANKYLKFMIDFFGL